MQVVATPSFDLAPWQAVPQRVVELLRPAAKARRAHEKAAAASGVLPVANATWAPEQNTLYVYTNNISEKSASAYQKNIANFDVQFRDLDAEPDWAAEIFVKRGSGVPIFSDAWRYSNKMLGGPNPLTNGVVAGLLGAGLGYGGGALIENLFPARYVERGKLRRTLAALGGLGGVGMGAAQAARNAHVFRTGFLDGMFIDNNTPPPYTPAAEWRRRYNAVPYNPGIPVAPGSATKQIKTGYLAPYNPYGQQGYNPMGMPTVSVPNFNNAVWRDVRLGMQTGSFAPNGLHTPPQTAAMATGLMSGIGAAQRSSMISPASVIGGIASAGVGLATANIAGRTLSALAGLTPEAQHRLQDMGLFAGMLHSVVPAAFGM